MWSTTPEMAEWLLRLEEPRFVDAVNSAFFGTEDYDKNVFNKMLGMFPVPLPAATAAGFPPAPTPPYVVELVENKRGAFPLRASQASEYVRRRLAILGFVILQPKTRESGAR